MKASIDSIETLGLVDGPEIRTVIFFTGCKLRCKYCHNPEMWTKGNENYTVDELVNKILRYKPYYKNNGGVTFSGGEPLLHIDFLLEICKKLKEHNINIAIDTAGVGLGEYDELLKYVDIVLLDIKHISREGYKNITGRDMDDSLVFMNALNRSNAKVWIRQVIVPNIMDNEEYMNGLHKFIKQIKNVERIDFLPYHKLGSEKYERLGIPNPYKDLEEMSKEKSNELYENFMKLS